MGTTKNPLYSFSERKQKRFKNDFMAKAMKNLKDKLVKHKNILI
uniref:Uncharacterized protein n=1 Tax=viral metagenome TaxID=1070528 RepID=A0A6C0AYQ5_9ZZZZ